MSSLEPSLYEKRKQAKRDRYKLSLLKNKADFHSNELMVGVRAKKLTGQTGRSERFHRENTQKAKIAKQNYEAFEKQLKAAKKAKKEEKRNPK